MDDVSLVEFSKKMIGVLGIGVAVFLAAYHYNKIFLDWLRFQSIGTRDYIVEKLKIMFIDVPPQRILLSLYLLSFGSGTVVFLTFLPNFFPALLFGTVATVVGWKAPKPIVDFLYRKRTEKFVGQMVDALSLMSNGLRSGLSIVQSLGLVTAEMPHPIKQEFSIVLSENQLGVSLEDAFNNLAKRVQSDDVEMFVTAINVLKETGGNLAETFDTIVNTIRERIKVERKISAMTAQGFYQGMFVVAIPPILGVVFYQTDPEFMEPLFTTTLGWLIIFVILLLEVVGFFVIMKVIKIEV
jgi:tight adherence protein B